MNNEERILDLLEKLTEKVDKQGEVLARHTEILAEHSKILAEHGKILAKHSEMLEELDDRSLRSAVILENEVQPKLQLLYEGQVHLQETLAPKERVEVLEDEVVTLKSTMKMMMKRLDALEKAQ